MRIACLYYKKLFVLLMLPITIGACSSSMPRSLPATISDRIPGRLPTDTSQAADASPYVEPSSTATIEPTKPPSPTVTITPSASFTATAINTPTETVQPTITPTYAILHGTILEQANCRYGPGAAYLYKYGVYSGYYMDIIGRNDTGSWVVVQAIGGNNPCWVKASLINIKGDVMSTAPTWLPLPESPYYGPLTGVWAERSGDEVIISWDSLVLRAGDDSLQYPYLVEAWLCVDGQLTFEPIGSWETILTVKDQAGCTEKSHARVYGVEKHGYTAWVAVPWPQPQ